MYLGLVDIWTKRAADGIAECEHALELDRNLADAHTAFGIGKIYIGHAEETETHINKALRLSPRDTLAYRWMTNAGLAKNHLGGYEQAIAWCRRAIEANRSFPYPNFFLAAALAQLGRLDEASSAVKAGLALNPDFTISRVCALWTAMSDDLTYRVGAERILKACARPEFPTNDRDPPARRDSRRRCRPAFAPHVRGRGGDSEVVAPALGRFRRIATDRLLPDRCIHLRRPATTLIFDQRSLFAWGECCTSGRTDAFEASFGSGRPGRSLPVPGTIGERQQKHGYEPFAEPFREDRYLRTPAVHPLPSPLLRGKNEGCPRVPVLLITSIG